MSFECSMCTFVSYSFHCISTIFWCAMEHPAFLFLISVIIGIAVVSNIQLTRRLCDMTGGGGDGTREVQSISYRDAGARYDYGIQNGPHNWNTPDCNQSPINIIDEFVQKFPIREPLTWNHYDDLPSSMWLENNGHTVILRATYSGNVPTISGADLLASYTFIELCFRWNLHGNNGSEHMINYRKFPLEIQTTHRTGPNVECTSSYDLLMIGYFFEISASNVYLDPLIQNLNRVREPFKKVEIPPFPLSYLCHQFRCGFYSYGGSLTEPPCYQGAEWFIFPEPMAISEGQLNEFRQLLAGDRKSRIVRNSRPVQFMDSSRIVHFNQYNPMEPCEVEQPENEENCDEESFD